MIYTQRSEARNVSGMRPVSLTCRSAVKVDVGTPEQRPTFLLLKLLRVPPGLLRSTVIPAATFLLPHQKEPAAANVSELPQTLLIFEVPLKGRINTTVMSKESRHVCRPPSLAIQLGGRLSMELRDNGKVPV